MIAGKVVGTVWSTRKEESLNGLKFLVIQPIDYCCADKYFHTIIAADIIGAGVGEIVLVVKGSSARRALKVEDIAVDATVVGIIDDVEVRKGKKDIQL